jgi:hypothetical protein
MFQYRCSNTWSCGDLGTYKERKLGKSNWASVSEKRKAERLVALKLQKGQPVKRRLGKQPLTSGNGFPKGHRQTNASAVQLTLRPWGKKLPLTRLIQVFGTGIIQEKNASLQEI